jgi:hypothetical protein
MDVHINGTIMNTGRKVPDFVVQDAASHEDGVRTGALIVAAAAPRGTQINVTGIVMDTGTLGVNYGADGNGGVDAGTIVWKSY